MRTRQARTSTLETTESRTSNSHPGRVGPNAAIQLIAALQRAGETDLLDRLFDAAGRSEWLREPPASLIDERDAARLHLTLRDMASPALAEQILADAGRSTADYLLAHRIPKPAQWALRCAPRQWAAAALTRAISANAWTFAGSGRFESRRDGAIEYRIYANPLCQGAETSAPLCVWHCAVFARLFEILVARRVVVRELECCGREDPCCRFVIDFGGRAPYSQSGA